MNTLYYGDCLTIMREKMRPESVDLVYLDPPFNSNEDYNSIYSDETGRPLRMALEVKGGGNVGIADVGYLSSVLKYDNVQMAGFITLREPGKQQEKNFKLKMALAGEIEIEGRTYPRMQMLSVREILAGARFAMPSPAGRSDSGYDSDLFSHSPQ